MSLFAVLVRPASGPALLYAVTARDAREAARKVRSFPRVAHAPYPVRVAARDAKSGPLTVEK